MQKDKLTKLNKGNKKVISLSVVIVIIVAVGIPLWVLHDKLEGGPEYRLAKSHCGTRPVAGFAGIKRPDKKYYVLPSSKLYQAPSSMYDRYFCTEQSATDAGYERWRDY